MLRPVETPTREIKKLDGLWAFSLDRENCGIDQRWWESALQAVSYTHLTLPTNRLV